MYYIITVIFVLIAMYAGYHASLSIDKYLTHHPDEE